MTESNSQTYSAAWVAQYFDELGQGEWERLVKTPLDEVSLYIHAYYLRQYVPAGATVLEIGAGAGRFTQILAEIGAQVVVGDISAVQLELNQKHAQQYGFAESVDGWYQLDVCDMTQFEDGTFDCVVAYGGLFSYVLDRRAVALAECIRVLKQGGHLLAGVISLWGAAHQHLAGVLNMDPAKNQQITTTGDILPGSFPGARHFMHMFRQGEFRRFLERGGLDVLLMSASRCLSQGWDDLCADIRDDAEKWAELLRIELEACADEGAVGMGPHMLAVAKKPHPKNVL